MDETTGGTAFVPLATIVAFISNHLVFPDFLDLTSILRAARAWSQSGLIGDNPQRVASVCAVGAQEPEPVL